MCSSSRIYCTNIVFIQSIAKRYVVRQMVRQSKIERLDWDYITEKIGEKYLDWYETEDPGYVLQRHMEDIIDSAKITFYEERKKGMLEPTSEYRVGVYFERDKIYMAGPFNSVDELPLVKDAEIDWFEFKDDMVAPAIKKALHKKKISAKDEDEFIKKIIKVVEPEIDNMFCNVAQELVIDSLKNVGYDCHENKKDDTIVCYYDSEPFDEIGDDGEIKTMANTVEVKIKKC